MKHIFFILAAVVMTNIAFAQSTSPRFGTTAGRDNTFRVLTNGWTAATDAAGADTISYRPTKFNNYVKVTMTDSVAFSVSSLANSFAGDILTIIAVGDSGDLLKFTGSNILSAGNASLSTNGRAVVKFVFDGAKWAEASRAAH